MESKEKTGQTAVVSAGHGQTSILTSNLFQVTSPFYFSLYLSLVGSPQTTQIALFLAFHLPLSIS